MKIREKKIIQAIIFFASRSNRKTINRLKLMKLLWLSDRMHINKYGRLILKDQYNALPYGSIPCKAMDFSNINMSGYYSIKEHNIKSESDFDAQYFSKSDIEVMEFVWKNYGTKGKYNLSDFSHKFPEWLRFKENIEDIKAPNSYKEDINDFFECPDIKDFPFDEEETKKSKSIFYTHSTIQSNLSS